MSDTKIPYATKTWNPVVGCTRVSAGCAHCWAERLHKRLYPGTEFSDIQLRPDRLDEPLRWRKPQTVFVCSMSDLFHEQVPDRFIADVLQVTEDTPQHTYFLLTKRPENMRRFVSVWFRAREPASSLWLGVSVENQETADQRVPLLLETPAAHRWVSLEPMLGPVDFVRAVNKLDWLAPGMLTPNGIDWLVVGGESGPGHRPLDLDWARSVREQCRAAGVPYYGKQDSGPRQAVPLPGDLGDKETPWEEAR